MAQTLPNIVYIHTHDTGRCISPYGFKADTPNLEAFARNSIVFRNAHSAAPTCSPSRAALLTGQYPHQAGMLGLAHFGHSLKHPEQHLLFTLRENGYTSVLSGMQHVSHHPGDVGYDRLLMSEETTPTVDTVCPAFEKFAAETPAEPFFASVGFTETHRPFEEPTEVDDPALCQIPSPIPDTPQTREDAAAFSASLRRADEGIGRVLTALKENGLYENSIIIITTDHGPPFPEMKCNATVHGTGVMLMMRGPGIPSDTETGNFHLQDALVSQVDVFPTLCELTGIAKPDWLQGVSLLPLMRGEVSAVHEEIFAECTEHVGYEPVRAIRTNDYIYIRRFGDPPAVDPRNCDDSPSKSLWLEEGWLDRPVPAEELYHTRLDPQERRNLADVDYYASVREDLRERLGDWMKRTGDVL